MFSKYLASFLFLVSPLAFEGFNGSDTLPIASNHSAHSSLDGELEIRSCYVHLIEDIELPSQETGQLLAVMVREGQYVEAGNVVARVDDTLAQWRVEELVAKLEAATKRAEDEIEIKYAQAAFDVADQEFNTNVNLTRAALAQRDLERSRLTRRQAELAVEQARHKQDQAKLDLRALEVQHRAATEQVERHLIRAPFDCNVLEVFRRSGEWVNSGDRVLRLARMDTLQVRGWVSATAFNPQELENRPVTVTHNMARGQTMEFQGQVSYVGLIRRGTHNNVEFEVWADVKNQTADGRWLLMPGSEVVMRIQPE